MKHKVSELTGALLDAAVAKAEGLRCDVIYRDGYEPGNYAHIYLVGAAYPPENPYRRIYRPTMNWDEGGPIIERERIELIPCYNEHFEPVPSGGWSATVHAANMAHADGTTLLIAAMRAFAASKFGEEVEL